jgi:hypothetical protein
MNPGTRTKSARWAWRIALATLSGAAAGDSLPFVLESDAVYVTAFGDQFYGAVTAGPGEYFAVWVDLRVGGANPAGYDLYGQRILPDGTLGAPGSLELLRDLDRLSTGIPAVAWNGSVYLVAWNEGSTLYGMRVAPDGTVLNPGGFVIGTTSTGLQWPSIASDGENFLVVQPSGGAVLGWRVFGDDTLEVEGAPITISSGATGLGYPKVAFGGGVYVATWAQAPNQAIRAARVTPAGVVLDPGGVNVSGGGTDVDAHVDYDGQNFYIVWQRNDGQFWDIWGAHLDPQAQVVSGPTLLLDGNTWGGVFSCQVAFNGSSHLIAITTGEPIFSNTDLYALEVSAAGQPLGAPFPVSTLDGRSQTSYGIASVGDQFFIVWEYSEIAGVSFVYDTEGARISSEGDVLDAPPIKVSTSAAWQIASTASFDGENFLAAFEDWRPGGGIAALRVTPDGLPLEQRAFNLASAFQGRAEQPEATYGGGQHVVVFENRVGAVSQVRMTRVLPDGTVLDPGGILIFQNEPTAETFRPKVAWNGQHYCVVWNDNYLFPGQEPLQYAFVAPDGTIAVGPTSIAVSDGASLNAFDIASDGDKFLVAWVGFNSVKSTRISAAGVELNTNVVQSTGSWITELPRVACNGESYFVAWRQYGDEGVTVDAKRLSLTGAPLGGLLTVAGPASLSVPLGVFARGSRFQVTGWGQVGNEFDLFSTWFDGNGAPFGSPEILTTLDRDETYAGTSARMSAGGDLLLVHSLWASNPYNAPRAHGQVFDLGDSPPGDLDDDGDVDLTDLSLMLTAFGVCDQDPDYNPLADIDGSGCVDLADLSLLLAVFGT